ncbi:MAG: undecaprenyldiphospho-muramoylpentapeptide beta-N-acetylglucosaminyltransferase [Heliobacteriaceae bacterium]|jgi:UDP-N-acetylglucosamine--N-acetylmuramyl-(pentapeptide) pyrophosphoryl-undecaprenol N-acetylglucosamine transferase|nr:undecaprenyldiphospho-muramoylpentapeptide beta-N-acetylglucosaminyltransferase [Heliobacteriaceae bacterium]
MCGKEIYFVTGGGTGGHIYPAAAVADALLEEGHEVYYAGSPQNPEFEFARQKGYSFLAVKINSMPREFGIQFIKWLFNLLKASFKAGYYLKKYKPCAVFGTGGYVCAPVLIACRILKCPYMIHDCDAMPGLVSRKLAPFAASVSLGFESAKQFIKNKNIHVNGNPVRAEFKTLSQKRAREILGLKDKLTLCVTGGSQGAKTINDAAVELLKEFSEYGMQVIFQTGRKNFERVIERLIKIYPEYENDKNLIINPYFDNMAAVLKAGDIAVSRAGALSLSEICASGAAPVIIPFPHAAADHQRKNALYMVEHNAAICIEDPDLTKQSLKNAVMQLAQNPDYLNEIKQNSFALAKFDGCEKIIAQLKGLNV